MHGMCMHASELMHAWELHAWDLPPACWDLTAETPESAPVGPCGAPPWGRAP